MSRAAATGERRQRRGARDRLAATRSGAPLLAALLALLVCGGCASYWMERTIDRHAQLREASLEPWLARRIGDQAAPEYLLNRTAIIFAGVDQAVLGPLERGTLTIEFSRDGVASTSLHASSAVPLTGDGYFLTAAHCVNKEPYIVVLRDRHGHFMQGRGRTVWDGSSGRRSSDVALIHVEGVEPAAVEWCELSRALGGSELLCCGSGFRGTRLAGGRMAAAPASERSHHREADPGQVRAFRVDLPMIPGDSGGPVILPDGRLLGIATSIYWTQDLSHAEVLRPDPAYLRSLIEADRACQSASARAASSEAGSDR